MFSIIKENPFGLFQERFHSTLQIHCIFQYVSNQETGYAGNLMEIILAPLKMFGPQILDPDLSIQHQNTSKSLNIASEVTITSKSQIRTQSLKETHGSSLFSQLLLLKQVKFIKHSDIFKLKIINCCIGLKPPWEILPQSHTWRGMDHFCISEYLLTLSLAMECWSLLSFFSCFSSVPMLFSYMK